jgi:hypothetical protein
MWRMQSEPEPHEPTVYVASLTLLKPTKFALVFDSSRVFSPSLAQAWPTYYHQDCHQSWHDTSSAC